MFKTDGPIFTFLGKIFDMMVVSLIWLVCCLPVVTIGAATTALYYTVAKVIRRDRGYIFKEYFKAFKMNFWQGTIIWLITAALACLFYFEAQFAPRMGGQQEQIFTYLFLILGVILLFIVIYVFPILSRFSMNIVQIFRTAIFMMLKHFLNTIGMAIIVIWAVFISSVLPPALMFIPGVAIWMMTYLMEPVLKKYTPKAEENPEDEDSPKRDEWYLE